MTPHGRLLDRIALYSAPLRMSGFNGMEWRQVSLLSLLLLLFGCRQRVRYMPRQYGFRKTRLDFIRPVLIKAHRSNDGLEVISAKLCNS